MEEDPALFDLITGEDSFVKRYVQTEEGNRRGTRSGIYIKTCPIISHPNYIGRSQTRACSSASGLPWATSYKERERGGMGEEEGGGGKGEGGPRERNVDNSVTSYQSRKALCEKGGRNNVCNMLLLCCVAGIYFRNCFCCSLSPLTL